MSQNINSYSEMLDIPVNTCVVTVKEDKKKATQRKKLSKIEDVKKKLLEKINNENAESKPNENITAEQNVNVAPVEQSTDKKNENLTETNNQIETTDNSNLVSQITITKKHKNGFVNFYKNAKRVAKNSNFTQKLQLKNINFVSVQIAVIVFLIAFICITSVANTNSGIAVFMRSIFSPDSTIETMSNKSYNEYAVNVSYSNYNVNSGVITVSETGSVYSPLDGIVTNIINDLQGYTVEISHSENFKTKISGLTYAFCSVGENVYSNVPIGYLNGENYSVCFYDKGELITDYGISNNTVVWQV